MLDVANIEHDFRKCTECELSLPLECFRHQGGKRPRYRSKCKECESAAFKERYRSNGDSWSTRTPEARQAERAKAAEKAGRDYRSLGPLDDRGQAWIEKHLDYDGEDCLIYPGGRKDGYGPSRYVCERAHGPAPTPQHEAAHSCGNGRFGCVHPKHLSWKTPKDNASDSLMHGTAGRKLALFDVILIRHLFECSDPAWTLETLAREFGISRSHCQDIVKRKAWNYEWREEDGTPLS